MTLFYPRPRDGQSDKDNRHTRSSVADTGFHVVASRELAPLALGADRHRTSGNLILLNVAMQTGRKATNATQT